MSEFEGRTAVITGASRGLGAALAEEFLLRGMRLGLCSRSRPVFADEESVVAARVDVRDEKAVADFVRQVEARLGKIDLWINNAGVLDPIGPLRDLELRAFREHIDVNLSGVFIGTRAYVRHLRARDGEGVLINISSGAAWHGYAGWSAYCAGKAGVDRLTECVQLEERDHGLRAYAVAPGVIDTAMQERIRSCSPDLFPEVERFLEMKREGNFNSPAFVARELLALAFDSKRRSDEVVVCLPDEKA